MTRLVVHLCRGREWRGGERQVALLAGALHRRGLPQLCVTGRHTVLARALAREGIPHREVPWAVALDPRALLALLRLLAAAGPLPPILHAHDSHALILAGLAAGHRGLPLVATRRSSTRPGRLGWWRRADRVVAISEAVRRRLLEAGVDARRITVIPSAVDVERLRRAPPDPWQPPAGGRPYLVAVGALTPEKGHRVLLEAHARLAARPLLVLVGAGRERQVLQRLARERGTAGDVLFVGEVPDALPYIRGARALVQPSRREALGTAVLEALALGTSVIASDTGGLAESLAGGAGTLVPPDDAAALAASIAAVLQRPAGPVPEPPGLMRFALDTVADRLAEMYTSAPDPTEP